MGITLKSFFKFIQDKWLLVTGIIVALISILSLYPVESLPPVPGTDKTHHFIAYAALAFPLALARPKMWLAGIIVMLGYSGAIELIQPYVNRYGEWLDLGANALGLVFGIIAASLIRFIFLKQKTAQQ